MCTVQVSAKSEDYEKNNFLFYLFVHVFLGVEYVFIIKNGNFQAFFLQEVGLLYSIHYFT